MLAIRTLSWPQALSVAAFLFVHAMLTEHLRMETRRRRRHHQRRSIYRKSHQVAKRLILQTRSQICFDHFHSAEVLLTVSCGKRNSECPVCKLQQVWQILPVVPAQFLHEGLHRATLLQVYMTGKEGLQMCPLAVSGCWVKDQPRVFTIRRCLLLI